jgi:tetratricopeptide (TPR) repeat protein
MQAEAVQPVTVQTEATTAQAYRDRFRARARRVGEMACAYFHKHAADSAALDAQRMLLWQAMEVNYHYAQDWAMVVACAQVGHEVMIRRGYWTQWGELLTLALDAAQRLRDPIALAQVHYWLGSLRHRQCHWAIAADHYSAASEQYQALGDTFWRPRIWRLLSEQYRERGEWQQAEALAHQARVAQEQNGDAVGLAATYSALGHLAFRRNAIDEALHWLQQALAIPELAQDRETEAGVHSRLGNLYSAREAYHQARYHYAASRAIAEQEGDDGSLGTALHNLALLYSAEGNVAASLDLMMQAREHFTRCGDQQGVALVHFNLSATYSDIGEYATAIREGEQAIRLARQLGDWSSLCLALANQAEDFYRLGDFAQAQALLDEAVAVRQRQPDAVVEENVIAWQQALLLVAKGDYASALPRLRQTFAQIATYSERLYLFSSLLDLVAVTLAAGKWAEAADWLAQARTIALDYERSDFIGLVEQWYGDAARRQGDGVQAQHHYAAAHQAFAAKDDARHRYLQKALQEHLAPLLAEGNPIASCGSERANFGEPLA